MRFQQYQSQALAERRLELQPRPAAGKETASTFLAQTPALATVRARRTAELTAARYSRCCVGELVYRRGPVRPALALRKSTKTATTAVVRLNTWSSKLMRRHTLTRGQTQTSAAPSQALQPALLCLLTARDARYQGFARLDPGGVEHQSKRPRCCRRAHL